MNQEIIGRVGAEKRRHWVMLGALVDRAAAMAVAKELELEAAWKEPKERFKEIAAQVEAFGFLSDKDSPSLRWTRAVPVSGTGDDDQEFKGFLRFSWVNGADETPDLIAAQFFSDGKDPNDLYFGDQPDFVEVVQAAELDTDLIPAAHRLAALAESVETYAAALQKEHDAAQLLPISEDNPTPPPPDPSQTDQPVSPEQQ